MPDPLLAQLERLLAEATPRPWEQIMDRRPARDFASGQLLSGVTAPDWKTLRIVDPDVRLLVRIGADPEQVLSPADVALIVALVNAAPHLIAVAKAAETHERSPYTVHFHPLSEALAGLRAHFGEPEA